LERRRAAIQSSSAGAEMMNAPAAGKRRRTISTPSSVTGLSPALRLTAQFAPWPASILPNGQSPRCGSKAVRHALFESAADPSPRRIRQRAFLIQRLFAGYPQGGEVGILNTDNVLLRTNSQRGNSIDFLNLLTATDFSRSNPQTCTQTYPQLARENQSRVWICRARAADRQFRSAAATMNAISRPWRGESPSPAQTPPWLHDS
jgi:hypothetical protein